MNDAVRVARLQSRNAAREHAWQLARTILANPLALGLAGIGVNYALYRAGAYRGLPARSVMGGPVWFTIGQASSSEVEFYSKIEAFIMGVTAISAAAPLLPTLIEGGKDVTKGLLALVPGVAK